MPNPKTQSEASNDIISQVAERVRSSDNVLVALSKDPSVDELSAALGLTFILDKMGKHATAIFSGAVPNAIEFLEPEKTFETNTNSLQDFIIALDKEKADHLRYKIDGDYVKVFITPYKTTIDEKDMEFSHGDFNVDLVIALNVASSESLDSALSEYGRIMHDASSINISANVPGKFGDIEWGDPAASSVSEMIFNLYDRMKEKDQDLIDKPTATALLAGIVAATNRFSNERTTPETMSVASKLMVAGADQQLISSSIPVDILTSDVVDATADAEPVATEAPASEPAAAPAPAPVPEQPVDPTNLVIAHEEPAPAPAEPVVEPTPAEDVAATATVEEATLPEPVVPTEPVESTPAEISTPDLQPPMPEPAVETAPIPAQPDQPPVMPESSDNGGVIAPAAPDQVELSADPQAVSAEEQAAATAELENLIAPSLSGAIDESVMKELQEDANNAAEAADAAADEESITHSKKKLVPPSEALAPPKVPKDYAAMMSAELADDAPVSAPSDEQVGTTVTEPEPMIAPVPENMPIMDTSPEPVTTPSAPQDAPVETVNNEYVDPLPMPDANTILPPPPIPFDPAAAPATAADAPSLSAQEYAAQLQGVPADVANYAEPSMPAVAEPVQNTGGAMPDQVYPADPSAFQIPGM